jgi:hypothetical protein
VNDLPLLAPPQDGLRLAMSAARHRRLRTAGTTTSLAAAALSVAVVALGTQGTQTLLQEPAPELPAVTVIVEGVDDGQPTEVTPPQAGAPVGTTANVSRRATGTAPADAEQTTTEDGDTTSPRAPVKGYAAGPLTEQYSDLGVPVCSVQDATSLCRTASASSTGSTVELYAEVCSTSTATSLLHFPASNEVDFVVERAGEPVWQWSAWHPDRPQPHELALGTGACNSWSFSWTLVDAHGAKVPKGEYVMKARYLADEFAGRRVLVSPFTVG